MGWFVGQTGKSFFDGWSFVHFCFWVVFGSTMAAAHVVWWKAQLIMLAIAYGWEIAEYFLSRKYPKTWVRGPESKLNSWVSDPLMGVLGTVLGYIIFLFQ